jgi:hypothetical protein
MMTHDSAGPLRLAFIYKGAEECYGPIDIGRGLLCGERTCGAPMAYLMQGTAILAAVSSRFAPFWRSFLPNGSFAQPLRKNAEKEIAKSSKQTNRN